ncbi:MAG TPA: DUF2161 family putative PD-(D/E)XK-type phosphodiesterase [Stellaceae bacterium]|nr:DUF2161 family putative PD-(D/E)XK-type phosphodiesterase [Stellaceae bacterium]
MRTSVPPTAEPPTVDRPAPRLRGGFAAEVELYAPVKAFLEGQGYVVKGEVRGCDLVAVRGAELPVIVELKLRFSLDLVLQGVERLAVTPLVYLAVPRPGAGRANRTPGVSPEDRTVQKLCRRIGLGLMTVGAGDGAVAVLLDPLPYRPRLDKRRAGLLLGEHRRRHGDPTAGGITKRPIMTAYRQEALRCARLLAAVESLTFAQLRAAGAPNAAKILRGNVYGWFERVGRATYRLTPAGHAALGTFAEPISLVEETAA